MSNLTRRSWLLLCTIAAFFRPGKAEAETKPRCGPDLIDLLTGKPLRWEQQLCDGYYLCHMVTKYGLSLQIWHIAAAGPVFSEPPDPVSGYAPANLDDWLNLSPPTFEQGVEAHRKFYRRLLKRQKYVDFMKWMADDPDMLAEACAGTGWERVRKLSEMATDLAKP